MEYHVIQLQGDLTFCLIAVEAFDGHELLTIDESRGHDNLCGDCEAEMSLVVDLAP